MIGIVHKSPFWEISNDKRPSVLDSRVGKHRSGRGLKGLWSAGGAIPESDAVTHLSLGCSCGAVILFIPPFGYVDRVILSDLKIRKQPCISDIETFDIETLMALPGGCSRAAGIEGQH